MMTKEAPEIGIVTQNESMIFYTVDNQNTKFHSIKQQIYWSHLYDIYYHIGTLSKCHKQRWTLVLDEKKGKKDLYEYLPFRFFQISVA